MSSTKGRGKEERKRLDGNRGEGKRLMFEGGLRSNPTKERVGWSSLVLQLGVKRPHNHSLTLLTLTTVPSSRQPLPYLYLTTQQPGSSLGVTVLLVLWVSDWVSSVFIGLVIRV